MEPGQGLGGRGPLGLVERLLVNVKTGRRADLAAAVAVLACACRLGHDQHVWGQGASVAG
jgi:hypothetical protein